MAAGPRGKLKIEILGRGCRGCRAAELNIRAALDDLQIEATVMRVTDSLIILRRGATQTPTVILNRRIVSSGIVPSVEEVKTWLARANLNTRPTRRRQGPAKPD